MRISDREAARQGGRVKDGVYVSVHQVAADGLG